jgi:hypothetical protein
MNVTVVVAHYNENIDWLKNIKYNVTVISKIGIPFESGKNRGNEASSYLEYIIQNYNNLSDYTIFIHGHQTAWHHKTNMDNKINRLIFNKDYYNINEIQIEKLYYVFNPIDYPDKLLEEANEDFINFTGIKSDYKNYHIRAAAQFYVSKSLIKSRPIEYYIKMYNWLMTTNFRSFWSSRVLEHMWHYIFTDSVIDIL